MFERLPNLKVRSDVGEQGAKEIKLIPGCCKTSSGSSTIS